MYINCKKSNLIYCSRPLPEKNRLSLSLSLSILSILCRFVIFSILAHESDDKTRPIRVCVFAFPMTVYYINEVDIFI